MKKNSHLQLLCLIITMIFILNSCGTNTPVTQPYSATASASVSTVMTTPSNQPDKNTVRQSTTQTAATTAEQTPLIPALSVGEGTTSVSNTKTGKVSLKDILNSQSGVVMSDSVQPMAESKASDGIMSIMPVPDPRPEPEMNTEDYEPINEHNFVSPNNEPLSTFSADVDTASWSNIRRFIKMNMTIPSDAVRIEEMVNYFPYAYAEPKDDKPFAVYPELAPCPWNTGHLIMRIGIQGKRIDKDILPVSNLVFLLDVSGSMNDALKLPLVKSAFQLLVEQLKENDRVSIVTYAGSESIVLSGASGENKAMIQAAINDLSAGGSTAGAKGLVTAYELASEYFLDGGNNRVILATDGDFNVGLSSDADMVRLIEKERKKGIFLSVLGFGTGNIKDSKMEKLADNGNGNYAYIDSMKEAQKVLVNEMGGTLFTIAKDVKFQVEFNPAMVKGYRLIGYENRMLAAEDFNNDQKDAGDIGAGHSVTAMYEIIPATSDEEVPVVDPLKYQDNLTVSESDEAINMKNNEWMTIKIRYKEPDKEVSKLITYPILKNELVSDPSEDFIFQSAVSEAGLVMRNSAFSSNSSIEHAIMQANSVLGTDEGGYRHEFVKLMEIYAQMEQVEN